MSAVRSVNTWTALGLIIGVTFLVGLATAQVKTQTAGVDNSRMGAYRALAKLSYQFFEQGDTPKAAELARVLERTWDRGEWHNSSEDSYCNAKTNRPVCQAIDLAMDGFIVPLMNHSKKAPDPATIQNANKDFLEKLKQAD